MIGMMHGGCGAMVPVIFLGLIAMGVGYGVRCLARQNGHECKRGKWLGWFITIVAFLGIICTVVRTYQFCCSKGKCATGVYCPFHGAKGGPAPSDTLVPPPTPTQP